MNKGDNNITRSAGESLEPCPVAVSILKEVCTESEALDLAREATKNALTEEQVRRVLDAYKGQVKNILNRGAWLRSALRRGFSPAAPLPTYASDQGGLLVAKIVRIPKGQAFWTGQQAQPAEGSNLRAKADSGLCVPQPGQEDSPKGFDILRATFAAKKGLRTA